MKKKTRKRAKTSRKQPASRRRKVVFVVFDGLADFPINNKTPLSAARKPNLDYLARNGILGELNLIPKNLPVSSHIGNLSLLGYSLEKLYLKRGPLEAVGTNLPYKEGHLAVRANFSTVDKDLRVVDRRAGRNTTGLDDIVRYVNENLNLGVDFVFRRTHGHRAVLIIKQDLSDKITDSDPLTSWEKVNSVKALSPEAENSARLVQEFIDKSRVLIEYHPSNEFRIKNGVRPANFILTREAGNRLPRIKSFLKKHGIKKAVCISENGVMKGTCLLAGFEAVTIPELKFESSLKFVFDNIDHLLPEYDFIYAHIKWTDEPGHDGEYHKKIQVIEAVDKYFDKFRNFDGILVVSTDHITSTKLRAHSHGNVPVLIYGKGKDRTERFDEFSAKKGRLKVISGKRLWRFVFGK